MSDLARAFGMLTLFEQRLLELLLDQPGEVFAVLRQQMTEVVVSNREFTGVGFFTEFSFPDGSRATPDIPNMELGDVVGEHPSLEHGAGFLLFLRNGRLSFLEGFTYDEEWPADCDAYRLVSRPIKR